MGNPGKIAFGEPGKICLSEVAGPWPKPLRGGVAGVEGCWAGGPSER